MDNMIASRILLLHLPEIEDEKYKAAIEMAIESLNNNDKYEEAIKNIERKLKFYTQLSNECEDDYSKKKFYMMADTVGECLYVLKQEKSIK